MSKEKKIFDILKAGLLEYFLRGNAMQRNPDRVEQSLRIVRFFIFSKGQLLSFAQYIVGFRADTQ